MLLRYQMLQFRESQSILPKRIQSSYRSVRDRLPRRFIVTNPFHIYMCVPESVALKLRLLASHYLVCNYLLNYVVFGVVFETIRMWIRPWSHMID